MFQRDSGMLLFKFQSNEAEIRFTLRERSMRRKTDAVVRDTRFGWINSLLTHSNCSFLLKSVCCQDCAGFSTRFPGRSWTNCYPHPACMLWPSVLAGGKWEVGWSLGLPWWLHINVSLCVPLSMLGDAILFHCLCMMRGVQWDTSSCVCCHVPGESKRNIFWAGSNAVTLGLPATSCHCHSWYHVKAQVVL